MKKVYTLFIALLAFGMTAQAQNISGAISACMDGDSVQITFDESLNCAAAPGDLAGMSSIGFHSGADQWSTAVAWDAAGASTAMNNGSDVFSVTVHPVDYYALTAAPTNIYFVFNQGVADPANPWGSEGKDDDGTGTCPDFWVVLADLAACTTSDTEVELEEGAVSIAPNPMTGSRTSLFVDAVATGVFDMTITNAMGQIVKVETGLSQDVVTIERGNLTPGIYFITIQGEKASTTQRLVIQ